jgi:formate--tetrahydrofolate ligase
MLTDIQINQVSKLKPIKQIAKKLNIAGCIQPYGEFKAKINLNSLILDPSHKAKLILVTSINPTPAGEGKTTTTIGLADALCSLGKKALVCLREPALGPVFGKKGGATGGGLAQVAPMEDINLHFNGDFAAIAAAHNLLAAMVDNHIYHGNKLDIQTISWRRVIDMNDRSLRDRFDIVVASEVMAILCLVDDAQQLEQRLGNITVGFTSKGKAITARHLKAHGAMTALLKEAIKPNLVQTLAGTPAIIHGGPFANIAHGCNSVIATRLGLALTDYVVTEAGFGSDLGAEKFLDIKCRKSGLWPDASVIVATIRAVKAHGKGELTQGFYNLHQHILNMRDNFHLPTVVCMNQFADDTSKDIQTLTKLIQQTGVTAVLSNHWAKGAKGAQPLAKAVMLLIESSNTNKAAEKRQHFIYQDGASFEEKINLVISKVYAGKQALLTDQQRQYLKKLDSQYSHYPICIAKTHSSLSTDADFLGIPTHHQYPIREFRLCTGAEYLVVLMGDIVTLPGLPENPAAERIGLSPAGDITGLS